MMNITTSNDRRWGWGAVSLPYIEQKALYDSLKPDGGQQIPVASALIAGAQALAALGFAYWMVYFSAYGPPAGAAPIGDRAPGISAVRVRDGATFELAAERGHPVLLVFFRGHW